MSHKLLSLLPYWGGILTLVYFFYRKQKILAREILWASFRTTIQLIFLAFALEVIFKSHLMIVSLLVTLVMTLNSSTQIVFRSKAKTIRLFWISFVANAVSIWPIAFLFSIDESGLKWSEPRMLLPLMGMLLGNTLSGVSIGLESFLQTFRDKKTEILTRMSLGATIEEATHQVFFRAVKAGISPQINSMISMGIVSIPGMMAGQLIAKADAFDASMVQIKMMLSICAGTLISVYIALKFVRSKMFLPTGELCLE
jgi:putative ABC transport system permease protein